MFGRHLLLHYKGASGAAGHQTAAGKAGAAELSHRPSRWVDGGRPGLPDCGGNAQPAAASYLGRQYPWVLHPASMAAKRPRVDAEEAPGVEEDAGVGGGGYVFDPAPPASLSIVHRPESCGTQNKIPVHRVYCVGRNYWDHGVEMGGNPEREPPFFFMKPADAVVDVSGVRDEVSFPAATADLHFECEMVLVINTPDGRPVGNVKKESAAKYIYGYAVGIDLTRRDLQKEAKQMRRCWSASKGERVAAVLGA
jgi:2-keto-4-pentenoate hydratase/2-oxohepta-3-ene-1,7-dioic acid hydratase in catechol pathway